MSDLPTGKDKPYEWRAVENELAVDEHIRARRSLLADWLSANRGANPSATEKHLDSLLQDIKRKVREGDSFGLAEMDLQIQNAIDADEKYRHSFWNAGKIGDYGARLIELAPLFGKGKLFTLGAAATSSANSVHNGDPLNWKIGNGAAGFFRGGISQTVVEGTDVLAERFTIKSPALKGAFAGVLNRVPASVLDADNYRTKDDKFDLRLGLERDRDQIASPKALATDLVALLAAQGTSQVINSQFDDILERNAVLGKAYSGGVIGLVNGGSIPTHRNHTSWKNTVKNMVRESVLTATAASIGGSLGDRSLGVRELNEENTAGGNDVAAPTQRPKRKLTRESPPIQRQQRRQREEEPHAASRPVPKRQPEPRSPFPVESHQRTSSDTTFSSTARTEPQVGQEVQLYSVVGEVLSLKDKRALIKTGAVSLVPNTETKTGSMSDNGYSTTGFSVDHDGKQIHLYSRAGKLFADKLDYEATRGKRVCKPQQVNGLIFEKATNLHPPLQARMNEAQFQSSFPQIASTMQKVGEEVTYNGLVSRVAGVSLIEPHDLVIKGPFNESVMDRSRVNRPEDYKPVVVQEDSGPKLYYADQLPRKDSHKIFEFRPFADGSGYEAIQQPGLLLWDNHPGASTTEAVVSKPPALAAEPKEPRTNRTTESIYRELLVKITEASDPKASHDAPSELKQYIAQNLSTLTTKEIHRRVGELELPNAQKNRGWDMVHDFYSSLLAGLKNEGARAKTPEEQVDFLEKSLRAGPEIRYSMEHNNSLASNPELNSRLKNLHEATISLQLAVTGGEAQDQFESNSKKLLQKLFTGDKTPEQMQPKELNTYIKLQSSLNEYVDKSFTTEQNRTKVKGIIQDAIDGVGITYTPEFLSQTATSPTREGMNQVIQLASKLSDTAIQRLRNTEIESSDGKRRLSQLRNNVLTAAKNLREIEPKLFNLVRGVQPGTDAIKDYKDEVIDAIKDHGQHLSDPLFRSVTDNGALTKSEKRSAIDIITEAYHPSVASSSIGLRDLFNRTSANPNWSDLEKLTNYLRRSGPDALNLMRSSRESKAQDPFDDYMWTYGMGFGPRTPSESLRPVLTEFNNAIDSVAADNGTLSPEMMLKNKDFQSLQERLNRAYSLALSDPGMQSTVNVLKFDLFNSAMNKAHALEKEAGGKTDKAEEAKERRKAEVVKAIAKRVIDANTFEIPKPDSPTFEPYKELFGMADAASGRWVETGLVNELRTATKLDKPRIELDFDNRLLQNPKLENLVRQVRDITTNWDDYKVLDPLVKAVELPQLMNRLGKSNPGSAEEKLLMRALNLRIDATTSDDVFKGWLERAKTSPGSEISGKTWDDSLSNENRLKALQRFLFPARGANESGDSDGVLNEQQRELLQRYAKNYINQAHVKTRSAESREYEGDQAIASELRRLRIEPASSSEPLTSEEEKEVANILFGDQRYPKDRIATLNKLFSLYDPSNDVSPPGSASKPHASPGSITRLIDLINDDPNLFSELTQACEANPEKQNHLLTLVAQLAEPTEPHQYRATADGIKDVLSKIAEYRDSLKSPVKVGTSSVSEQKKQEVMSALARAINLGDRDVAFNRRVQEFTSEGTDATTALSQTHKEFQVQYQRKEEMQSELEKLLSK